MSFRTASAILRGTFAIDQAFVHSHLSLIHGLVTGQKVDFGISERDEELKLDGLPQLVACQHNGAQLAAYSVGMYTDYERIPAGSVAIVNLFGPVLKYGDGCSYGMVDKASILNRVAASGKFNSVILDIDSPGGQADGTQLLADTIKNLRIPVIGVVNDGRCASAAMWIASACREIYATKQTDSFGSIGVYCQLPDMKGYFEKQGLKIHDIYSDFSGDKNKSYLDAMNGDYKLKKEELNFLQQAFAAAVAANRGDRLDTSKEDPFTGKMYPAQQALEIGLIDGIKSFEEVLAGAIDMGADSTSTIDNPNNMKNPFVDSFSALTALMGKETVTAEQVAAVNAQIEANKIPGITLVLDSQIDEMSNAAAEVTKLQGEIVAKDAIISDHKKTIVAQAAKLGKPSEEASTPKADAQTEKIPGGENAADAFLTSIDKEKQAQTF
jgi:protease-4